MADICIFWNMERRRGAVDRGVFEFTYVNNGNPAVEMTSLFFGIGDTSFIWDYEAGLPSGPGVGALSINNDSVNNGVGDFSADHLFSDFQSGETFDFIGDIDTNDGSNIFNSPSEAYDVVLFNNGAAPNATLTFTLSDGFGTTVTFDDMTADPSGSYSGKFTIIPEPASTAIVGGLLCVAGIGYRRRRLKAKAKSDSENETLES